MCTLCVTLLGIAILLVASLIPLYLNNHGDDPLGEGKYQSVSMNDIALYLLSQSF